MTRPAISGIAPSFIVRDVSAAVASYRDTLEVPLGDTDDGLRGFELEDSDDYVLIFGCPRTPTP